MTLAVVTGDCGDHVWSALEWCPVDYGRVLLVGVRSLSPEEEAHRLQASAIQVVPWHVGLPEADLAASLERFAARVQRVYVHLDLDALDPSIGRGVVDLPVPGGLATDQLVTLLDEVHDRFELSGATVATYTPANDDGSTLAVAVQALEMLLGAHRAGPLREDT